MFVCTLAAFAALWGSIDLTGQLVLKLSPTLPPSVAKLIGVSCLSLLAFAACACGFTPVPTAPFLEAMAVQPQLAAAFYGVGGIGILRALLRARLLRWRIDPVAAALSASLVFVGLWIFSPPFLTDETLYHLALPVQYLLHGGFVVLPGHANNSFPAFAEMISFWPLAAGSVSCARAIQCAVFALGTRAMAALWTEVPRRAVWWGCLIMLWTPVVLCTLPTSYVDIVQSVYTVVALLCLHRFTRGAPTPFLFAAFYLAGCAAACKFLGLALMPFMLLTYLLHLQSRQKRGQALPPPWHSAVALGLMLVPVMPWLLRNSLLWHNPLFPFATDLFAHSAPLPLAQQAAQEQFMRQFGPADGDTPLEGLHALVRLPFDLFFTARFDAHFDGIIGPLAWCVGGCVALSRRPQVRHALPPILAAFGVYGSLIWLSTSWQMRFLISPYWCVALAAPLSVMRLPQRRQRLGAAVCAALCILSTLPFTWRKLPALSGRMLGDAAAVQALRQERLPASPLCDALNSLRPPPARTCLVWTQRLALYCNLPLFTDSYDEAASFNTWLSAETEAASLQQMQEQGITHVLIDEAAFFDLPNVVLSADESRRLAHIFARYRQLQHGGHLRPLARRGHAALYALAP